MLHYDAVPLTVREVLTGLHQRAHDSGFALAGGTSLALRFGHRLSVDLDFFTTENFSPHTLAEQLGITMDQISNTSTGTLQLLIHGVKIDFLRHAYPLLKRSTTIEGIQMWSVEDVAAMKLNAIANRGSKKDFYDLHLLLGHHELPLLIEWFCVKYSVTNRFMLIRSLAWFEDAENEPDPVTLVGLSWQTVKSRVSFAVAKLD